MKGFAVRIPEKREHIICKHTADHISKHFETDWNLMIK